MDTYLRRVVGWGGGVPSIFLGTDEYSGIYSSTLYSSVPIVLDCVIDPKTHKKQVTAWLCKFFHGHYH
jgi:hypothetical protein